MCHPILLKFWEHLGTQIMKLSPPPPCLTQRKIKSIVLDQGPYRNAFEFSLLCHKRWISSDTSNLDTFLKIHIRTKRVVRNSKVYRCLWFKDRGLSGHSLVWLPAEHMPSPLGDLELIKWLSKSLMKHKMKDSHYATLTIFIPNCYHCHAFTWEDRKTWTLQHELKIPHAYMVVDEGENRMTKLWPGEADGCCFITKITKMSSPPTKRLPAYIVLRAFSSSFSVTG